jgi:hypothetical protein
MTIKQWTMVPDGWRLPPPDPLVDAKHKVMEAMRTDGPQPAQDRLARFYDTDGDYAGASFAQLGPIDPMDITPTDLLATTEPCLRRMRIWRARTGMMVWCGVPAGMSRGSSVHATRHRRERCGSAIRGCDLGRGQSLPPCGARWSILAWASSR